MGTGTGAGPPSAGLEATRSRTSSRGRMPARRSPGARFSVVFPACPETESVSPRRRVSQHSPATVTSNAALQDPCLERAGSTNIPAIDWLDTISQFWPHLVAGFDVLAALLASLHVLLHKRDSRAATLWLGTIWFLPMLGPLLYLVLGVNRIRRRAISLGVHQT